jgi:hypothetical protein
MSVLFTCFSTEANNLCVVIWSGWIKIFSVISVVNICRGDTEITTHSPHKNQEFFGKKKYFKILDF